MTRVRVRKVGVLVLAVPAVLTIGSGAARAGEVPRFDPPETGVLAGTTSFPGTDGAPDLDARYLTMPTPQPQPVPRPSGFK